MDTGTGLTGANDLRVVGLSVAAWEGLARGMRGVGRRMSWSEDRVTGVVVDLLTSEGLEG